MLNILDQKTFMSLSNTANGDVNGATRFYYQQKGQVISATYSGGVVKTGTLLGKMQTNDQFELYFQHITLSGKLKAGYCQTKIILLENDVIKLEQNWQWLNGDGSTGYSELIEVVLN